MSNRKDLVTVWDYLIRIFHWSLAIFFTVAYLTEDSWLNIHSYAGYTVFLLLVFRIVWGFIGSKYARFKNFITTPKQALDYLKDELSGDAKHYQGHNPAGAVMVVLLIISLLLTTLSGASILATEGAGPLANTLIASFSGELLEEVHELFTTLSLVLVFFHIGGVIFSSLMQEENLVKAMITGKKKGERQ